MYISLSNIHEPVTYFENILGNYPSILRIWIAFIVRQYFVKHLQHMRADQNIRWII